MTSFATVALGLAVLSISLEPGSASAQPVDTGTVWPAAKRIEQDGGRADGERLPPSDMSAEQKVAEATAALDRLEGEERSWTAQLVRTLLSLLLVVGLIYVVFKVVVPRLLGVSLPARQGKTVRVLERTQLDARHAVVVLEIDGKQRFLVGTGERGVQMLADLSRSGSVAAAPSGFQAILDRTGGAATVADRDANEGQHGKS